MNFTFRRKRIAGILTVVPANERSFVDEMNNFNFPEARSRKLKEVMGYDKRRLAPEGVCVSDLATFGLEYLLQRDLIRREEIDALILVTQTPDHFMPATSSLVHGHLKLKQDMLCMDINQACAGFVLGLIQGFMLLDQPEVRKVVLINSDVLSRKTSPKDRNIHPLVGDAASIVVLEADEQDSLIHANVKTDGSLCSALMIPAGGFRMPSTAETAILEDVGDNNLRAKDHLFMDGSAIFNFVQVEVPPLIQDLLARAGVSMEEIDFFFCHQPNRFMLQKLADKLKVPHAKMPNNVVENFGNNGGASIPTAITFNLQERLLHETMRVCFAGFGGGLTWSSMLLNLGKLGFNTLIDYK
jgi:3-oxoacyl-[acyl-carrier-protein] synthase-3